MYTLLYSEKSLSLKAPNRIIANDGREVEYTCMVDEEKFGPWQNWYKWPDAVVVGYAGKDSRITYISPLSRYQ